MSLSNDSSTIRMHDVGLVLRPASGTIDREALEALTLEVENVLYEHAYGEHVSAAVACSFDPPGIEIDLSIPAVSGSLVNRRVSEILEKLETHLPISLDLSEQQVERTTAPCAATA